MTLDFLTPELFDGLVWAVIIIGLALAGLRLYRDFSRPPIYPPWDRSPLPDDSSSSTAPADDDAN